MTRSQAKVLIIRLVDRGLTPVITKLGENEYTIAVEVTDGTGVAPADLQTIIDLGINVQVGSVRFT